MSDVNLFGLPDWHGTRQTRLALVSAYMACIVGANLMLATFGMWDFGFGPVPSGVVLAGLCLGIRDVLHEHSGHRAVLTAITFGGAVSWWIEPSFAVASSAAFVVSELVDMAIYTPMRRRNRWVAVCVSNTVGSLVDSALFLWLAFGSVSGVVDLTTAKALMVIPVLVVLWFTRRVGGVE